MKVQVDESLSLNLQASLPISKSIDNNDSQLVKPDTVTIAENKTQLYDHFKSIMTLISKDYNCVKKKKILEDLDKNSNLVTISKTKLKLNKLELLKLVLERLQV